MIKTALGATAKWIAGETGWLVLLAVAGVGAWLYVQFAQVRADRDNAIHVAEIICAGIGTGFAPSISQEADSKGKLVTVAHARGALCQRRASDLADFRARTDEATAATLAKALQDHDARQNSDSAAARASAEAARAAAERMETADAKAARTNIVDHEWFAAVNGVAGLRAPDR
ncbi:hypothetical protein AWL63_06155 [Sphingomonas panacis]|uniref:Uncharacterized protein n=1 Tax=Sphingomonas panacis TaxID=1560345 RepID=A0A1B3Z863_9SPHN|nr:hypothetical protein [Sphingomonas panacis]AOH83617.1 hypothetical protein AWL63_06155 [Sphingomonas panacis]